MAKRRGRLPQGYSELHEWMTCTRDDVQQIPSTVSGRWRGAVNVMNRHRWGYAITELTTLGSAAAIPVVAAAGWSPTISAILGAIVLIVTGVRTSFQMHENWLDNRRLVNDIEHEAGLFAAQASPYEGADASHLLALRVEDLFYEKGQRWLARRAHTTRSQSSGKPAS
jgi:hypothetical protein